MPDATIDEIRSYPSVQSGEALLMLAGGVEASISPWSIAAFSRIRALPTKFNDRPNEASRPFDKDRSGFVMAEGAGIVVVEALDHAANRGRRPLAEIIGFAQCGDGYSLVAPDSAGDGAYRAMRAAIEAAGIGPEQVTMLVMFADDRAWSDAGALIFIGAGGVVELQSVPMAYRQCVRHITVMGLNTHR